MPDFPQFYPSNRQIWRQWLAENHQTASGVWLIYYKVHTGKPFVDYGHAVEEALCYGWIDSKVNSLDGERYRQMFTPRKVKSIWSRSNKKRVKRLIENGQMTEAGLKKIEIAKQNGFWNIYDEIEDLMIPKDLDAALEGNPVAKLYFAAFSNSSKKNILWWIKSAKRATTRLSRIEKTVTLAAENKKANH